MDKLKLKIVEIIQTFGFKEYLIDGSYYQVEPYGLFENGVWCEYKDKNVFELIGLLNEIKDINKYEQN